MDWIKKNWKQTLIVTLITVIISTGGTLFVWSFTAHEEKLNGAASIDYVDRKSMDLKGYVDTQDGTMQKRIEVIEERQQNKADKADIERLYKKTEDNNKLLIDILKEIRK